MRHFKVSCRKLSICTLSFLLITASLFFLLIYIPNELSYNHEQAYFQELDRLQKLEKDWTRSPWSNDSFGEQMRGFGVEIPPEVPYGQRLLPLVHDIPQLRDETYREQLGLYENLTARLPSQRTWIYIGGTPREYDSLWKRVVQKLTIFTLPGPSCTQSSHICNSFNDAFNHLIEYYHANPTQRQNSALAFIDCDNTPALCDGLMVEPPMLQFLETLWPCEYHWPRFTTSCGVRWTAVPLPLKQLPWRRMISVENGRKFPVFPSAFEQLHQMISFPQSVDALEPDEENISEILVQNAFVNFPNWGTPNTADDTAHSEQEP